MPHPAAGAFAAVAKFSASAHIALSAMLASSRDPLPVRLASTTAARIPVAAMLAASGTAIVTPGVGVRRTVDEQLEHAGVAEIGDVVPGRLGERAVVAEAGDRAPDDARVGRAHGLVAQAQLIELPRPV